MPTALIANRAATSTEERPRRPSQKDVAAMKTSVVAAPTGNICADKLGHVVFATGKAFGWVVAFLTTSTSQVIAAASKLSSTSDIGNRIAALSEQIEEMISLSTDWNGQGSEPPNEFAREVAKQILLTSTTLMAPDRVTPSAQGGVGICFTRNRRYGDIEVLNTGEILATTSDRRAVPEVWEVKPTDLKGALDRIVHFVNS